MKPRGWFVVGLGITGAALVPPLHGLSERMFSWHMGQHLLLVMLAGPAFARAFPRPRFSNAALVCALHAVVLWAWHLPTLYDAALRIDALHVVEHVSFLVTAGVLWAVILERGAEPLTRIGVTFVTGLQSAALGALIAFASEPLYTAHVGTTGAFTALEDQQLAGSIMWVPPGVVYLAVLLVLVFRWFSGLDAQSEAA